MGDDTLVVKKPFNTNFKTVNKKLEFKDFDDLW